MRIGNRRFRAAAVLFLMLFLTTGCWDRTEINDLGFVLGSAVDKEKDGLIRLTVLLPLPGQLGGAAGGGGGTGGEKSYYMDSDVGRTIREAQENMQKRMARRLFFAHRRIILIGEELARDGIDELFDISPRRPENRMTTYMLVTKGKAYEVLQATPKFERFASEAVRELAKSRDVIEINTKSAAVAISSTGSDPIMVYMGKSESQKSAQPSKEVELLGYALFHGTKLVDVMEGQSAKGINWLRNNDSSISVTLELEKDRYISLQIFQGQTKIKPSLRDGRPHFSINVDARARLLDNRSSYDLSKLEKLRRVEKMLGQTVEQDIAESLKTMQKNGSDAAQLGAALYRAFPNAYRKQFKQDWNDAGLKQSTFDIHAQCVVTETGLIYENVTQEVLNQ